MGIISEVLIHTTPPEPILAPSQPHSFIHSLIFVCAGSSLVHRLSLVGASGVYATLSVCRLLTAVAFLVAEQRL